MKKEMEVLAIVENIPVIKAEPWEDYALGLKFFCEFCNKFHYHGAGEGHRVAHCKIEVESPFHETGYYLTK